MRQKSGSTLEVKGRGFINGKLYQSDRPAPILKKSSTET
jgi:hypothetical protein